MQITVRGAIVIIMIKKKTILLLYGGESAEHEVSIVSASNVYKNIDFSKFEVFLRLFMS